MRHGKKYNKLSRTASHRKAMMSNMASSLIKHKRITTTLAKARELRKFVEPLLTKSKTDSTHSRRTVFSYLKDKDAVAELFRDVAVKISSRQGGYTRILKTGFRQSDNAEMCFIELVDYNENMLKGAQPAKATTATRRSRRGGKKSTAAADSIEVTGSTESSGEATAPKAKAKPAAKEGEEPKKKAAPKKKKDE